MVATGYRAYYEEQKRADPKFTGFPFAPEQSFLLVVGFVGGFGYLVATMPRGRHDGWSGDDGAVV